MNLKPRAIILLAIDAFCGRVGGKTLLQKRLYFTEILLRESLGFDFDAHYYGPYSAVVSSELATLKLQGQLREESSTYGFDSASGFEMRRYEYELTKGGKASVDWLRANYPEEARQVAEAAQQVVAAGDLDYMDLSFAAKAHWILRRAKKSLSNADISNEAKRFGWQVEPGQIQRGVEFLSKIRLVHEKRGSTAEN
jgi:uncharacterized protein YwgA